MSTNSHDPLGNLLGEALENHGKVDKKKKHELGGLFDFSFLRKKKQEDEYADYRPPKHDFERPHPLGSQPNPLSTFRNDEAKRKASGMQAFRPNIPTPVVDPVPAAQEVEARPAIVVPKHDFFDTLASMDKRWMYWVVGIFCVMMLMLFFVGTPKGAEEKTDEEGPAFVTQRITVNETVEEVVYENVSFSKYLTYPDLYHNVSTDAVGYLRKEIEGGGRNGAYGFYLVDDFDYKIKLWIHPLTRDQVLPEVGQTDNMFTVTGTFEKIHGGIQLHAKRIIPTGRPVTVVTHVIPKEEVKMVAVNYTE